MDYLDLEQGGIGLIVALIALSATVVTAIISARQARRAALANELYAFLELRSRYHGEEMRLAIRELSKFAWPVKQAHADWNKWLDKRDWGRLGALLLVKLNGLKANDAVAEQEVLQALRHVASYFEDVGFLLRFKHIENEKCALSFINVSGLNVYYEVCVPLYVARQQEVQRKLGSEADVKRSAVTLLFVDHLRGILPQHGAGMRDF